MGRFFAFLNRTGRLCLLVLSVCFVFTSCRRAGGGEPGETQGDIPSVQNPSDAAHYESLPQEPVKLPFETTIDMTPSFSEEVPAFDKSSDQFSLTTNGLDNGEYSSSEDTFRLPAEYKTMLLHCTWVRAGKSVYIGFLSEETGEVYTLSFAGGTAAGTVSLDPLPPGRYKVILYSSNNENVLAVLAYQFR